ncbi:hypothetical protein TTHERM_00716350 (macronuclear) [Tetrahymena thermophila SB210]|uniref:Uncharacterized protein n=1 Tax=Tetrahymena thermophila (strain SB210) TaxID=312017 RepID=I7MCN0_TETTS|nr:hypothetical protein TTHERM_00716350 [Tetrahymena thermophila SB210]EAR84329.2 hypothetical protein TTHERM_00716350 [Tetrahymena thermophila SB210]|eukprot:XP_001031992.2 hypothetical protein TTHERM_00716350 [Tetrahymena thermophila SB210]
MDHHFHHIQYQQKQQHNMNGDFKKRPNTAIIMKQFYKPGERPKSSLQQHKLLEWKCECGEQLYVNKVLNLTVQSAKFSKAFPGRKIGLQNSNLIQKMKGNDLESKMKFKEMSVGSKISPYDILMEKYSQLKQQEDQQINVMNYTNNYYEQQPYKNSQNFQQNAIHFQPIQNFNNYQQDSQGNDVVDQNYQYENNNIQSNYNQSNFFNQGNPLIINNLIQQEEQFQEEQLQDEQQNSINIDSFQRPQSAKNNFHQQNKEPENVYNVKEENEESLQAEENNSSQQIQNHSQEHNQIEDQIILEQQQQQDFQSQQQQNQEEQLQYDQQFLQQLKIQNENQIEKENLNMSGSNRSMQYMQYQQNILDQKLTNQDQSIEEYPEPNQLEKIDQVNQFEQQENQVINDYQKQQHEKRQIQLNKNKQSFGQNTANQRFFSAAAVRKQSANNQNKHKLKEVETLNQQFNQIHDFNYSIDNVSILSEKKPKRPQTSNLARPVNINLDIKEVLTLKRVGSAQTVRNEQQLAQGNLSNQYKNKQTGLAPYTSKNQYQMINGPLDDVQFSDYICNNAFHRPSSQIKNSSFYTLQQRTKLITEQQSPQIQGQAQNGNIKGLFQQPLINDLGKQVNIRQLKQMNKAQQQQNIKLSSNKYYDRQHIDTQTDELDNIHRFSNNVNNPTHYPFKVKNLVNQQSSQLNLPLFSQSVKNINQRPQTSLPYKRI